MRSKTKHNYEKSVKLDRKIISVSVKRKAADDICEKLSEIIYSDLKKHTSQLNTISVKAIHNIRNNIDINIGKIMPPLPKNKAAVIETIETITINTIKEGNFVFIIDDVKGIVVFS